MNAPRRTAAAVTLLVGSGVGSASAQLLLFPASGTSLPNSFFHDGLGGEPPCRQHRRLEPWRAHVRDQCAAECRPNVVHAAPEPPVERTLVRPVPPVQLSPLFKEMDSFFDSAFARPSDIFGSSDPFEGMFQNMVDFSLRAFDQFDNQMREAAAAQVTQDVEEEEEEGEEGEGTEEVGEASVAEAPEGIDWEDEEEVDEDVSTEDVDSEAETAAHVSATPLAEAPPQTPQQAAELALDSAVASFARAAVASSVGLRRELPRRLVEFGQQLLSDAKRRRLSEGEADPHAPVKERLGRRLSEYEIFFTPRGGMTVYTTSGFHSPFATSFSAGGFGSQAPSLGMDTDEADDCLRSRFRNGDLEGGCLQAVKELLDAAQDEMRVVREVVVEATPARPCPLMEFVWANANAIWAGFMFLVTALLCVFWTEEEEVEEEADEYDYGRLPEDEGSEEKVFVGVPVQVV